MPKISVIVPVYNVSNYLKKCLDSILSQTFSDIEIICVNDGSTDSSLEILQDYQKRDNRIIVVSQENKGLGAARNVGFKHARGEYIGFVDSDDFIAPCMFERLYERAVQTNSDVVISGVNLYFDDTKEIKPFRDINLYSYLNKLGAFSANDIPTVFQLIGVWDKLYRKTFLQTNKILNPENRIYEDVLFTVKVFAKAERISVVDDGLYFYRKNTGRSIVDKESIMDSYKFDFLKNLEESKDYLKQNNLWEKYRNSFLEFQVYGALYHHFNITVYATACRFQDRLLEILSCAEIEYMRRYFESGSVYYPKVLRCYLVILQMHSHMLTYIFLATCKRLYKLKSFLKRLV